MRKRRRGEDLSLSAADWNRLIDGDNANARGQRSGRSQQVGPNEVWLKNSSGIDFERFDVVQFELALRSSAKNVTDDVIYISRTAGGWNRWTDNFGVCSEPIANGRWGRLQVSGVAMAKFAPVGPTLTTKSQGTARFAIWDPANMRLIPADAGRCECLADDGGIWQVEHYQAMRFGACKSFYLAQVIDTGTLEARLDNYPGGSPYTTGVVVTYRDEFSEQPLAVATTLYLQEYAGRFLVIDTNYSVAPPADATDLASAITATNAHKTALQNAGIYT